MKNNSVEEYFKENSIKFDNTIKYLKERNYNSEQILRIVELNVYVELKIDMNRDVWLEKVLHLIEK